MAETIIPSPFLVLLLLAYGGLLFLIAAKAEKRGLSSRLTRFTFPLSLAVYCTSWTFFGSTGAAVTSGFNYLAIFVGPILFCLIAPYFLVRMATLTAEGRASSLSDFIGQRYGRSRSLAALVASLALIATAPYLALQIKAISTSFELASGHETTPMITAALTLALALFAIIFGTRRKEVTGRNPGLVAAIAVENLVKLLAFALLGVFAVGLFYNAPAALQQEAFQQFRNRLDISPGPDFVVQALLSALALFCLPRQFMLLFVEARDPAHVGHARWALIAYLTSIALVVPAIVLAGFVYLPTTTDPDHFVLALPLAAESSRLLLLAFLLGISAATAMILAETLALSTMAANDLLAPLLIRTRLHESRDLGKLMLQARRAFVFLILSGAWAYSTVVDDGLMLAATGFVSLAGVAQFAPALVGAVFFGFENQRAARLGLWAGVLVWAYTLFLPSMGDAHWVRMLPEWLDPHALFGLNLGSPLVHGTVLSLSANVAILLLVARLPHWAGGSITHDSRFGHVTTLGELTALVGRFVGDRVAEISLAQYGSSYASISGEAAQRAEQIMADVIGTPSARLIISSTLAGSALHVNDVVRLLDRSGQSLQFSRSLLEATLQTIDPAVAVTDRNLRLVAWNQHYIDLFQFPPELVGAGRPVADMLRYNAERGEYGPGSPDELVASRLHHLSLGLPKNFERLRPSGRWLRIAGAPMPGGGYVMSYTDVTASKAAQVELEARVAARTADLAAANAALAEAKRQAEAATREKTRFLAAASHDLLQPLHAARLFLSALERQTPEQARPLLENSVRSIAAADSLLRALLDVSKLDAGGIVPKPTRFSADGLVAELGLEFTPLAAEKGLVLHTRGVDLLVETDRDLLRSVLMNFLSNAVRYTAKGHLALSARKRGAYVRFAVHDSGQGIPPSAQKRIFREFERLDGSAPGVGLGLAIVDRTARLLGTPLRLRSSPGTGSVFAIDVPIARKAAPPSWAAIGPQKLAANSQTVAQAPTNGLRVLCVDDDPAILEGLASALMAEDFHPIMASTAAEALAIARTEHPDAAILDYHLGEGEDGIALADRLRSRFPDIQIALVTAEPGARADPRLKALGVQAFAKPVDPQALFQFLIPKAH